MALATECQVSDYYRVGRGLAMLAVMRTGGPESHADIAMMHLGGPVCACLAGGRSEDYLSELALAVVHVAKTLPGCEPEAKPLVQALAAQMRASFLAQWATVERFARRGSGWA